MNTINLCNSSSFVTQQLTTCAHCIYTGCSNLTERVVNAVKACFSSLVSCLHRLFCCSSEIQPPMHPLYIGVTINQSKLSTVPSPLNIYNLIYLAQNATPVIIESQIIEHFNEIFSDVHENETLYRDLQCGYGVNISKAEARGKITSQFLDFIRIYQNQNSEGRSTRLADRNERNAQHISALLKAIIFELRKPELANDKKKEVLKNLASAAEHCVPRRYAEVLKIYKEVSNQVETLDEILLQFVQTAKEDLIQNYYSLSTEPVQTLNKIRKEVGGVLGLDRNAVSLNDRYIETHNDASYPIFENGQVKRDWLGNLVRGKDTTNQQFLATFNRIYTPINLVNNVKRLLNERVNRDSDFADMCRLSILEVLPQADRQTERGANFLSIYMHSFDPTEDANFPTNAHTSEDKPYYLTEEGARFMLVEGGFLNIEPNGSHIIYADRDSRIGIPPNA